MARVIGYVKLLQNGTFFAKDAPIVFPHAKALSSKTEKKMF